MNMRDVLARYAAVFRLAWQHRHELVGPKRLSDEVAFLPAALSLQETPPHPAPRRAAIAICALFVIALAWSIFGEVDIVAVAQGRIAVSQHTKVIQPLEASVVKAIHVKDGDHVQQGQLLIELDATAAQADSSRLGQERAAAMSEALRTQALINALSVGSSPRLAGGAELSAQDLRLARAQLQTEWADITAKLAKLDAEQQHRRAEIATVEQQIDKLQTTLPMARQREQDFKALTDQGFMAGHAAQDRTRERVELEKDLATAQARKAEAGAALRESEQAMRSYRAETLRTLRERLAQAELKRGQTSEEATKAGQRERLTRLVSPVTGTVQQLAVHTAGGVVTPAQALLVVVPDDAQVTAEVTLENKDVGFVREGQPAEIKLETFPYTRYGTVAAVVDSITADAVIDDKRASKDGSPSTAVFPATLALKQSSISVDGRLIHLSPGMNVTAEVRTGRRRVIDYLLSPVQRHLSESMKER